MHPSGARQCNDVRDAVHCMRYGLGQLLDYRTRYEAEIEGARSVLILDCEYSRPKRRRFRQLDRRSGGPRERSGARYAILCRVATREGLNMRYYAANRFAACLKFFIRSIAEMEAPLRRRSAES